MKLTVKQQDLYDALKVGHVCMLIKWGCDCYYFRTDTMKRCTIQARFLLKHKLVKVKNEDWRGHTLYIQ